MDVKMVLHGHVHETNEYIRKGIKFLNAGGSVIGVKSDFLNINVINISREDITNEIVSLKSSKRQPELVKDFSLSKTVIQNSHLPKEICLN
jgi:predicted phosphodiesterase